MAAEVASDLRVFIVIPVHNRRAYTEQCLSALEAQSMSSAQAEVVVVDDGSSDGTAEMIAKRFPKVRLIPGDGGLWWTGAMQLAVDALRSELAVTDYLMTLNNDVLLPPTFIEDMVQVARRKPGAALSPVARGIDGRVLAVAANYLWMRGRLSEAITGMETGTPEITTGLLKADVLFGRASMFPASLFLSGMNFDGKAFPQYWGDTDFSLRAGDRLTGQFVVRDVAVTVYEEEESTGIHFGTRPTGPIQFIRKLTSRRSALNLFDALRFALRHAPAGRRLRLALALASDVIETALISLRGGPRLLAIARRVRAARS